MQIAGLRETVDSGQVFLDPEAGERLRTMLTGQLDQVDGWLARMGTLAQRAPLGANPVGDAMAAKFELRAHDGPMSFAGVMSAYRDVLAQTLDTVSRAIHTIERVDADACDEFHRVGEQA